MSDVVIPSPFESASISHSACIIKDLLRLMGAAPIVSLGQLIVLIKYHSINRSHYIKRGNNWILL